MRVSTLIEILLRMPQTADVFVNCAEVQGAELMTGRVRKEPVATGKNFKPLPQGRDEAVVLTRLTEFSDGTIDQTWVFAP